MTRVLLVPDLPGEHWPAMDRYASRLVHHLDSLSNNLDISVATKIGRLTVDRTKIETGERRSGARPLPLHLGLGLRQIRRYVRRYWTYPRRVGRMEADVEHVLDHSYAHLLLHGRHRPTAVTVHDLIPMMMVQRPVAGIRGRVRNWLLRRTLAGLRQADALIVATQWLKDELAEWLGSDPGIKVIPYGVDDDFFVEPDQDPAALREANGIPVDAFVVLHVGSVGARKNVSTVVATVAGLRQRGVDAWLLQVGGGFTAEQEADLEANEIRKFSSVVGPTSESDLRLAYRAANALLFPSHYEGVGLPVLEAMASGLPVVTSGAAALKEVAGNAAVVVSGREVEPYVTELMRLAEDSAWREGLIASGLEQAGHYRWIETARKTAEVYHSLV